MGGRIETSLHREPSLADWGQIRAVKVSSSKKHRIGEVCKVWVLVEEGLSKLNSFQKPGGSRTPLQREKGQGVE